MRALVRSCLVFTTIILVTASYPGWNIWVSHENMIFSAANMWQMIFFFVIHSNVVNHRYFYIAWHSSSQSPVNTKEWSQACTHVNALNLIIINTRGLIQGNVAVRPLPSLSLPPSLSVRVCVCVSLPFYFYLPCHVGVLSSIPDCSGHMCSLVSFEPSHQHTLMYSHMQPFIPLTH